jgi:predicted RNase H-like HicB family nuclease
MIDPYEYSITIKKALIDGEHLFEAIIQELPDVVEYGQTYDEAYELAIDTITTAAAMCTESNTPFPQPLAQKKVCYA